MKLGTVLVALSVLLITSCSGAQDAGSPVARDSDVVAKPAGSKILVAYQSRYGSTRQYAEWISSEVKADLLDLGSDAKTDYSRYDIIVFGGYLRMGNIPVSSVIKDNWQMIKGKKIILFTASGTPPGHPNIGKIYDKSIPAEIRKEMRYFAFRGRLLQKDIGLFDSMLVSIGRMVEKDESLRAFMSGDFDGVRKENIQPLLDYLRSCLLIDKTK
jgi:menaquinone-dependent protoporphyrinogen IX oxidase